MLDPQGRAEVMDTIRYLNKEEGKTIVLITHYMEEASEADRVFIMADGAVTDEGTPREVFSHKDKLEEAGLLPPLATQVYYDLKEKGLDLGKCPVTLKAVSYTHLDVYKRQVLSFLCSESLVIIVSSGRVRNNKNHRGKRLKYERVRRRSCSDSRVNRRPACLLYTSNTAGRDMVHQRGSRPAYLFAWLEGDVYKRQPVARFHRARREPHYVYDRLSDGAETGTGDAGLFHD